MTGLAFGQEKEKERSKNPKVAFYYSLIPGLGQIYNGKWIKSAMIVGLEIAAYVVWTENRDIYNDFEYKDYPLRKRRYLEKRNKYAWWIGFIYVYGMIDAVVDAHLYQFENLMESQLESEKKGKNKDAE
jgi:hypothetical protein